MLLFLIRLQKVAFFVFRIQIDTVSGDIKDIVNEGFRSSGEVNKDEEGIAFFPRIVRYGYLVKQIIRFWNMD